MVNFAVLGLGMMGEAIMYDVLSNDDKSIVYGFELVKERREELILKYLEFGNRIIILPLNLNLNIELKDNELLEILIKFEIKVVYGAIDYKYNSYLSYLCLEVPCNYLDLGGNPEVVARQRELHELAIEKDVTIIPDCGLAPGMANILAASIMSEFDELDSCKIRVGGLPQEPKTILNYQQVFAIRGLTNEYLEDCDVIRESKLITVASLTELENLTFEYFDLPELEAFQTAGGTSSLPVLFEGRINNLDYKTIRYKGHCQFIQFLKKFELLTSEKYKNSNYSVREVIEHYLQKNLPRGDADYVLVKIEVTGKKAMVKEKVTLEILDKFDEDTGFSAMARTTAFPIAILGMMIASGEIIAKGVVPGETVTPYDKFKDELKKRNIDIITMHLNDMEL